MPSYFKITVKNESGADGKYLFCAAMPSIDLNPNAGVSVTVWEAATIAKGGESVVSTTDQYFAWCGLGLEHPVMWPVISGGESSPVTLGTNDSKGDSLTLMVDGGEPHLVEDGKHAIPNCYSISVPKDFETKENVLVGLSQPNEHGEPAIAAYLQPSKNMTYQIGPSLRFFVNVGDQEIGQTLDYMSFTGNAGEIDFTPGNGHTAIAIVTHTADGEWKVQYVVE